MPGGGSPPPWYRSRGEGNKKVLVLTRRKEETIVIGDSIEITVLGIRGEQVRLGISAPAEVPVHRKEIYQSLGGKRLRPTSAWARLRRSLSLALRRRFKSSRRPGSNQGRSGGPHGRSRQRRSDS